MRVSSAATDANDESFPARTNTLESEAQAHVQEAIDLVVPGGLFCIRVNAVGTEIEYAHRVLTGSTGSGMTIRYDDGPKRDLAIHFFARDEIERLTDRLVPISPLRIHRTHRQKPSDGHWDQRIRGLTAALIVGKEGSAWGVVGQPLRSR